MAALGVALLAAGLALWFPPRRTKPAGPIQPVQVGGRTPGDIIRAASTPVLAIDPKDARHVLLGNRVEAPRFGCDVFASADGGLTWRRAVLRLPRVGQRCYAPYPVYTADGRAHLLLTMLGGRGNEPFGAFLYESRDGGLTFGPPQRLLRRDSFQSSLSVSAGGRLLYLTWLKGSVYSDHATFGLGPPPNPVEVAGSHGAGRPFTSARRVSAPPSAFVGAPVVAAGPGGEIYVLYLDYQGDVFDYYAFPGRYGGRFRLMLAVSRDSGRSFARQVVDPNVVPTRPFLVYLPPLPALAVDPRTGELYAAWEDGRSGGGDVLLRTSRDDGRSWTGPRRLFDTPAEERAPALAAGAGGRLVAIAYRLNADGDTDVVVRSSRDRATTFSAPAALTPSPFDARIAPALPNHSGDPNLGSRLGLAVESTGALAAWADTRTGTRNTGKVDIFVRRVPDRLPGARALAPAAAPRAPAPSLAAERLHGDCAHGPPLDSRGSPLQLVRSFVAALDSHELRRAYGYLDRRWREGRPPARTAHPFADFVRAYAGITCARLARADPYDVSEDGKWHTVRIWAGIRRGGPTRMMIGTFWTHSDTAHAPWSAIGLWTTELPSSGRGALARPY